MNRDTLLTQSLAKSIKKYLKAKKSHTLLGLARKSGVSYATVRRLAHGEGVASTMSSLALIAIILTVDERFEFLKEFFPVVAQLLLSHAQRDHKAGSSAATSNQDDQQGLSLHRYLLMLLQTGQTLKVESVRKKYGEWGMRVLDSLEAQGKILLNKKSKQVVLAKQENSGSAESLPIDEQIEINRCLLSLISPSSTSQLAVFNCHLASVNPQGRQQLATLMKKTDERVAQIINDPGYAGNLAVYAQLFAGDLPLLV